MAVDKLFLPEIGFVRLPTILAHVPVSRSLWWEGVRTGRFPKPIKLAPRVTAWRVEEVRSLILTLGRKT